MKRILIAAFIAFSIGLGGSLLLAAPESATPLKNLASMDRGASRACLFPVGGWTIINCSNAAAASSAQLNEWSRYVIQCGDDSYIATDDAATGGLADANDGYIPSGAWLEFLTTESVRYISCLNINKDSDCRIWECL
jgi:hypothetical protein